MKLKNFPLTLSCLFFFCLFASPAQALRVKQIDPANGVLTLDDSRKVRLAGLHLTPESFKSLAILFSNQEIDVDEEKALAADSDIPAVYISVKTLEIPFPFKANMEPRGVKLQLNEMLISTGLASVNDSKDFKKKEAYLKLQEDARLSGKGMWSQEPPIKKK